jgi:hypothetical protein
MNKIFTTLNQTQTVMIIKDRETERETEKESEGEK